MSALPPRVKMLVALPRLPDWMTVNPGALRRICSMSVTCRDSISCRSITVTDDPVSPTGRGVFVAVTTTGSRTSAGSGLAWAVDGLGGGVCAATTRALRSMTTNSTRLEMTRVILSSRRPLMRPAQARTRSPGSRIHLLPALPGVWPVALRVSSPFTVAGQRRSLTGFPSIRAVHGSATVYLMAWLSRDDSGERQSMNGEACCDHALVLPRRQVG